MGRAIAERLARDGHVVVLDPGAADAEWTRDRARITALGVDPEARNVIRNEA